MKRTAQVFLIALAFFAVTYSAQYLLATRAGQQEKSFDPHVLFEAVVRTVIDAGDAVRRTTGNTTVPRREEGVHEDGTPDVHTGADGVSAALFAGLRGSLAGISVVEEGPVTAGTASLAPTRASARSRTHAAPPPSGAGKAGGIGRALLREALPGVELALYVDPLDGSTDFAEGETRFASVSACITRCGIPIAAALYLPFEDGGKGRLYWTRPGAGVQVSFDADAAVASERGVGAPWSAPGEEHAPCCAPPHAGMGGGTRGREGAGKADVPPTVPAAGGGVGAAAWARVSSLLDAGLRVVVSKSHTAGDAVVRAVSALTSKARRGGGGAGGAPNPDHPAPPPAPAVLPLGGAGYKAVQLLERRAQLYAHAGNIRKWDTCAGEALLTAAGGVWTDWQGGAVDYCIRRDARLLASFTLHGVLASTDGALHAGMREAIREGEGEGAGG